MKRGLFNDLRNIYEMMEDEESKEIYVKRLLFLVTGDYSYMHDIIHKYVPDIAALNDKAIPMLLEKLPKDRDIILYGAGEDAKANLNYFISDSRFKGFCDQSKEKQSQGVKGYPVIAPETLFEIKNASIVISTHRGLEEIKENLLKHGVEKERIYIMSPYMFASQEDQYFNPDFMEFGEEVFVDAGCCNLETVKRLEKHAVNIKKVYAFEPDPDNYEVCKRKANEYPNGIIEVFPYGTWSGKKKMYFSASADGCSHIAEQGSDSINVVPIDDFISNETKVTFIKMDVEGSELETLIGAQRTILRDKPKLAVCIYHKPEDMVELPLYIKRLVPEYKLYLRHHSNGEGETVLYAVMDT